ncbi:MAG TPA: hypothetical protein VK614_05170 [Allosphingosinicella sp.]|jgi:hypothetical protein|nr:hypothetical protein [Allosphingosinicella sp.]
MKLQIDEADLIKLKPETRADLIATLMGSTPSATLPNHDPRFDWDGVVDLTPAQVVEFMEGAADKTAAGLKIFAERGTVILANELNAAGITNYGHFQGRVTQRTRTITRKKKAFLFTWDDWTKGENAKRGFGHYAISRTTRQSLRDYFKLD